VKGATAEALDSVELTVPEWGAAGERLAHYHLNLVGGCLTTAPRITVLEDPARLAATGKLEVEPFRWRFGLPQG
jgi:hypothetical protein